LSALSTDPTAEGGLPLQLERKEQTMEATAERRLGRARRSRDQAMEGVLTGPTQGLVVTDDVGRVQLTNERARHLLGTAVGEGAPLNVPPAGCFLPDGVTAFPEDRWPVLRALGGERVEQELLHFRSANGAPGRWVCASSWPLSGTGAPSGAVLAVHEVSEESVGAAARERSSGSRDFPPVDVGFRGCVACVERVSTLRQRHGLVMRAVEQTADSVVITDRHGIIEWVNPAFEVTTGYTAAEAIGGTPRLLKSGVHDDRFYGALWRGLLAGTPFVGEIVNRKKSGALYRSQQSITPMTNDAGEITHFVSVLKDVTELRRAQERELYMDLAQEVQRRFYRVPSALSGYEVAAAAHPAHLTGGDYFDILPLSDGSLFLVIGDVVGHGIGAALVMAGLRASVRAFIHQGADPGEILSRLNTILLDDLAPNQFVTLLVARLEPDTGAVQYASAGHISGHIVRTGPARGSELPSTGMPLGLFPECIYDTLTVPPIASGDMLVLVTDGIVEATNQADEEFGTERLLGLIREQIDISPAVLLERLGVQLQRFAGGADQKDDVTSVICRRL